MARAFGPSSGIRIHAYPCPPCAPPACVCIYVPSRVRCLWDIEYRSRERLLFGCIYLVHSVSMSLSSTTTVSAHRSNRYRTVDPRELRGDGGTCDANHGSMAFLFFSKKSKLPSRRQVSRGMRNFVYRFSPIATLVHRH